jgi:hypothetical protein
MGVSSGYDYHRLHIDATQDTYYRIELFAVTNAVVGSFRMRL